MSRDDPSRDDPSRDDPSRNDLSRDDPSRNDLSHDLDLLAPAARALAARERLAEALLRDGHARLEPALPEAFVVQCLRALRGAGFAADQRVDPDRGFQIWRFDWDPAHPSPCLEHPLCDLGRAFQGGLRRWLEAVTGLTLASPELPFEAQRLGKGGFLDPRRDERAEAPGLLALLHLATAPWPATWGGHVELSDATETTDEGTTLARPKVLGPAWNALDLVDLRRLPWHRVPLLTRHVDAFHVTFRFREITSPDLRR